MKPVTLSPRQSVAAILVLASICAPSAEAFAAAGIGRESPGSSRRRRPARGPSNSNRAVAPLPSSPVAIATSTVPPTWDDLSDALRCDAVDDASGSPKPLVTLYRDTNGWCPFCERVWVILRAKGIPYEEQLVSLQNKPDWFKALVPTALVPAMLFHEDESGGNERRIVWESSDIIAALDEQFPDTPKMVHDTPEYEEAVRMNQDLTSAGFGFIFAGRNDTLSEEDKSERRTNFISELDRLDAALEECQRRRADGVGGECFRLGGDFTGADALMIPTLERWRYQLPLTTDIDIQEGRPALTKWFQAMDSYEPYYGRVAGDAYSWTATNSVFLRYFGGEEGDPGSAKAVRRAATIRRADDAADRLSGSFAGGATREEVGDNGRSREAAARLVANHAAVVGDCTRDDPASQRHVVRAPDAVAADAVLRHVTGLLVSDVDTMLGAREAPLPDVGGGSARDAAAAARVVASRLCVPRDMGAPAASILRAALTTVADRLEE